jgi:serine phosphatase RsbU (regulator of sigma subunit)
MKLKNQFLVFFVILASVISVAEGQDSLSVRTELAQKRSADSIKSVELLRTAEKFSGTGDPDSAIAYIQRSLEYATSLDFRQIEAAGYALCGSIYDRLSDWEDMLFYYLKASSLFEKLGDRVNEAALLKIIAGKYFELGIYKKSAFYFEQEFSVCQQQNPREIAMAAESAGKSFYFQPDDSLSIKWYTAALHFYEKTDEPEGKMRCMEKLAALYTRNADYDAAENIYREMQLMYVSNKDIRGEASACNNMGYLRFRKSDFANALNDFLKAAELGKQGGSDAFFLTDVYSNIAICYQNLGKKTETLQNFNSALDYAMESGRTDETARLQHYLAIIYFRQKDYYHADLYCQDCIESGEKSSSAEITMECYKTWSGVKENGNDFILALKYYEKYLSIRDSLGLEQKIAEKNDKDRRDSYEAIEQRIKFDIADQEIRGLALKSLKAESSRKENELKYLLKQKELDRSEKERLSQSLTLEREHSNLLKREQEVRTLEQQKINDSLSLKLKADEAFALVQSNRILENDKKQQELMLEKQKQYKRMAVGIVILLFIVAASILGGLVNSRRKNFKLAESKRQIEKINSDLELKNAEVLSSNEKILQQKDIIEQKNQAITDSIQYASRIQTAVLPPADFITELGIENFILYKPKDIISGDFYWGMKKDKKIYIAAADCTGHGVPGALMSMLGHVFLDEILHISTPANAAAFLDKLRDEVINTLKQKGVVGEARDGMDISLCIIDHEEGMIDFAGANNPLYLIRDNKLTKIPADRMPIGINVTTIVPFTNQSVKIRKGDYIYMFSDGYADQFGGPKGRKFMYRPFQELLLRNHSEPMDLQKEILDSTFIKWIGDRSQVDDVLVIGMRL